MKLILLHRLILTAFLLIASGVYDKIYAMTSEEIKIIYPGKGLGTIRIDEPKPDGLPSFIDKAIRKGYITLKFSNRKTVEIITITSDRFFVAISSLRVGNNNAGDVKKFYGSVDPKEIAKNRTALRYPLLGIDFEIDRFSEKITAITIYRPEERLKLPELQRLYREQFKQMKQ